MARERRYRANQAALAGASPRTDAVFIPMEPDL